MAHISLLIGCRNRRYTVVHKKLRLILIPFQSDDMGALCLGVLSHKKLKRRFSKFLQFKTRSTNSVTASCCSFPVGTSSLSILSTSTPSDNHTFIGIIKLSSDYSVLLYYYNPYPKQFSVSPLSPSHPQHCSGLRSRAD